MIIQLAPEMKAAIATYVADVIERRHGSGGLDATTALSLSIMFRAEAADMMAALHLAQRDERDEKFDADGERTDSANHAPRAVMTEREAYLRMRDALFAAIHRKDGNVDGLVLVSPLLLQDALTAIEAHEQASGMSVPFAVTPELRNQQGGYDHL